MTDPATSTSLATCPRSQPLIYVASLGDYNNGHLHGVWIRADRNPSSIREVIHAMLEESCELGAEEWAIHDHDGFGPLRLGESASLKAVSRVAQGIARHGPAFAHWAATVGLTNSSGLDQFDDVYLGTLSSAEQFATERPSLWSPDASPYGQGQVTAMDSASRVNIDPQQSEPEQDAIRCAYDEDGSVHIFSAEVVAASAGTAGRA